MSCSVVSRCLTEYLQEENRLPEDNFSLIPKDGYLSTSMRVGVRAVNPLPRYWFRDTDSGLQESLLLFNRLLMLKWIWNEMQLEYGLRSAITFEISGWSWRFIYLAGYLAGCLYGNLVDWLAV